MTRNKTDTEKMIKTNQCYVELIAKQYQNRGLTKEQLIGKVVFRVYPFDKFGGL